MYYSMHALNEIMFTALGSTSHKTLDLHAEWAKTSNLTEGNFDLCFQIGDMPPRVFPIRLYREAIRLQCFPPTRYVRAWYVKWAWILCLNNWRPITTWLCKALVCSIIDVLQYACYTPCFFFCLVCGSFKKSRKKNNSVRHFRPKLLHGHAEWAKSRN